MRARFVTVVVAIAAVAALAGGASAARSDEGDIGTVAEVAGLDPGFSTVLGLFKAAGLSEVLSRPKPHFTIFMPNNGAFRKLEKQVPGVTKALTDPRNRKLLADVLRYHVVPQEISSFLLMEEAKKGKTVTSQLGKTANGRLKLAVKGLTFTLADSAGVDVATVIEEDVQADNGAIHVVDRVLVPKSVVTALKKAGALT